MVLSDIALFVLWIGFLPIIINKTDLLDNQPKAQEIARVISAVFLVIALVLVIVDTIITMIGKG